MAKSSSGPRRSRPHHDRDRRHQQQQPPPQMEPDPEELIESKPVATAVADAPPPAPAAPAESKPSGGTGEDVSAIDAETNAKYEQVKGGKLYIKDLQQMDIIGLHEIARQENIQ